MHVSSSPAILYFGTPVVLSASANEDGTHNLAPMSSAFWLGWRCVIGLAAGSKTAHYLARAQECVLNLPSENEVAAVNRLARTPGSHPVPATKQARGYQHVHGKFGAAGLTRDPADTVRAPRVSECPGQMEAVVEATHGVAEHDERLSETSGCAATSRPLSCASSACTWTTPCWWRANPNVDRARLVEGITG